VSAFLRRSMLLSLALLLLVDFRPVLGQSRMSPETLKKLKAATVYIETTFNAKPIASGTGFVIETGHSVEPAAVELNSSIPS